MIMLTVLPMSTLYNLPDTGHKVTLFTHLSIREDAHNLFGFGTSKERATFRALIKVSGIGARMALAILSGMSAEELALAISKQETGRLIKIPGIGKKTAERLLLELRDKLGTDLVSGAAPVSSNQDDILNALMALGYSAAESATAVKKLPDNLEVAEGIRQALKSLARN